MATLNLRPIPDDLHRTLRVAAASRGISIKALVIEILRQWEAKGAERLVARPAATSRRKGTGA